jgi:hypothetical protein
MGPMGYFFGESSSHSTNLTRHLNLLPKSRMHAAYPPFSLHAAVFQNMSTCTGNMNTSTCIPTNIYTCSTAEKIKPKKMQSTRERTNAGKRGKPTALHKYFFFN